MKIVLPFLKGNKSQIAVIFTFIIALLLLFVLVFANIAKVSDVKRMTAITADKGGLKVASALGRISWEHVKEVDPENPEVTSKCSADWPLIGTVAVVIGSVVLIIMTAGLATPAVVAGISISATQIGMAVAISGAAAAGYLSSQINTANMMNLGFPRFLSQLSTYNAIREGYLGPAGEDLQNDIVMVKLQPDGTYLDASTGVTFDLKDTEIWSGGVLDKKTGKQRESLSRYAAWYWSKRAKLIGEGALAGYIHNEFLKYMMNSMFFSGDDWNKTTWQYEKISFPVTLPAASPSQYSIVNSPEPWVKDDPKGGGKKIIFFGPVDLNGTDFFGSSVYTIDGFLNDKFRPLCERIVRKLGDDKLIYGPGEKEYIAYRTPGNEWMAEIYNDDPVTALAADLKEFMFLLMGFANQSISSRMLGLSETLPNWYDFAEHPNGAVTRDGEYTHDVYQRLYHQCDVLEKGWIPCLERLDAEIRQNIADPPGDTQCWQGRGADKSRCYTAINDRYCSHDVCEEYDKDNNCVRWGTDWDSACDGLEYVTWAGDYATCTGNGKDHTHNPACKSGDLYKVKPNPDWCSQLNPVSACQTLSECPGRTCINPSDITIKTADDPAFYFQGQMSYRNPEGLTEVAQALEVLRAFLVTLKDYRDRVKTLGEAAYKGMQENTEKNELVYCWNDVDPQTGKSKDTYHLIRLALTDFPAEDKLPQVKTTRPWYYVGMGVCKEVVNPRGSFKVSAARYDTSAPGFLWTIRRYKADKDAPQDLSALVKDILSDGKVDDRAALQKITELAITSETRGTYGPVKGDIAIFREK